MSKAGAGQRAARTAAAALAIGAACAALPGRAAAQGRDTAVVRTVPERTRSSVDLPAVDRSTTPGGAFVRALILPGWGHAAIGAYTRGGFYFAAETTTGFLLARTIHRLGLAKQARNLREDRLREELLAKGVTADSALVAALDADPAVARSRRLVRSRHQQVEDWAALSIFLVFVSGADAFVSAHLRDIPKPIPLSVEVAPAPAGRGVALGLQLRAP